MNTTVIHGEGLAQVEMIFVHENGLFLHTHAFPTPGRHQAPLGDARALIAKVSKELL